MAPEDHPALLVWGQDSECVRPGGAPGQVWARGAGRGQPSSLQRQVSDGSPEARAAGRLRTPVLQLVRLRGSHGHVALGAWRDKTPGDSGPARMGGCGTEGCGPTLQQSGTEPADDLAPLKPACHGEGASWPAACRTEDLADTASGLPVNLSSSHDKGLAHSWGRERGGGREGEHPPGSRRG